MSDLGAFTWPYTLSPPGQQPAPDAVAAGIGPWATSVQPATGINLTDDQKKALAAAARSGIGAFQQLEAKRMADAPKAMSLQATQIPQINLGAFSPFRLDGRTNFQALLAMGNAGTCRTYKRFS